MEWYYILGIVSYSIFILQFILSNIGIGDSDIDIDCDGDFDFSINDLLSFKGLIHFAMGFSGWLMLNKTVTIVSIIIAIILGIVFMVGLYYIYKLCMKFNCEPTIKAGIELIGETATVSCPYGSDKYVCILKDSREIIGISETPIKSGNIVTITDYIMGIYYISQINNK